NSTERKIVEDCLDWWTEIDNLLNSEQATVLIPDICIAGTFKVLAKKYYRENVFKSAQEYGGARGRLRKDIQLSPEKAKRVKRPLKFHDIQTTRDAIISTDRFFETQNKQMLNVGIVDLLILAHAKLLIDFYAFDPAYLFIVSTDKALRSLSQKFRDVPKVFNPALKSESAQSIFRQQPSRSQGLPKTSQMQPMLKIKINPKLRKSFKTLFGQFRVRSLKSVKK
ncbi:hypothetical protein KKG66_09315, partial [bacterium]|nr:hypothetical protein [bacterium]